MAVRMSKTNVLLYPKKYLRHVFFASSVSGAIKNLPCFREITALPSFHSLVFRFNKLNEPLLRTTTLADFSGFAYLAAENKTQLNKDYLTFRQIEKRVYGEMLKQ